MHIFVTGSVSSSVVSSNADEQRQVDRYRSRDRQRTERHGSRRRSREDRRRGSRDRRSRDSRDNHSSSRETPEGGTIRPIIIDAESGKKVLSGTVLSVIGKRLAEDRVLAPPVHNDFVVRWTDILKLGLPVEERESLIKKYPPPENCAFLDPPKLNAEVDRAINDVARTRDKRIIAKHQKLTACAAGHSKLINMLLERNVPEDIPIIEALSDLCRLIIDAMHDESAIRRSLILANVNALLKSTLNTSTTDDYLFGKDLVENLKTSKLIDQSAEELKAKKQSQNGSKNSKGPFRPSNKNNNTGSSNGQKQSTHSTYHQKPRRNDQQQKSHYSGYKNSNRNQHSRRR